MLTHFRQIAKRSKTAIICYHIYDNWSTKRQFISGNIKTICGSTHSQLLLAESLNYIELVFSDYLKYSGLSTTMLNYKRVLEIGPGDNSGVALKFLLAGAKQVVCLDKFFSKQDWKQQHKIYEALREQSNDGERQIFDEVINLGDVPELP